MQLAKGLNITIFIVGHVTKEGTVAGSRMLEHMVDTVLYFEGDRYASYRILRGVKTDLAQLMKLVYLKMQQSGLSEVENPSEYMLNGRPENASGSVVVCLLEGTRPIMVEIQALVCDSNFEWQEGLLQVLTITGLIFLWLFLKREQVYICQAVMLM